jgi:hypothetical protein
MTTGAQCDLRKSVAGFLLGPVRNRSSSLGARLKVVHWARAREHRAGKDNTVIDGDSQMTAPHTDPAWLCWPSQRFLPITTLLTRVRHTNLPWSC